MIKRNGNDKLAFDIVGFFNLIISVLLICGSSFMFYLTMVDARLDKIEQDVVQIKTTMGID